MITSERFLQTNVTMLKVTLCSGIGYSPVFADIKKSDKAIVWIVMYFHLLLSQEPPALAMGPFQHMFFGEFKVVEVKLVLLS